MTVQTKTHSKKKQILIRYLDHIWMFINIGFHVVAFFRNGFKSDPILSACLNPALKSLGDGTRAADNDSHADSRKEGLLYRATAE